MNDETSCTLLPFLLQYFLEVFCQKCEKVEPHFHYSMFYILIESTNYEIKWLNIKQNCYLFAKYNDQLILGKLNYDLLSLFACFVPFLLPYEV